METDHTKSQIVAKAIELFSDRGCKGVTMDDIASGMHMSKRTLYELFANK